MYFEVIGEQLVLLGHFKLVIVVALVDGLNLKSKVLVTVIVFLRFFDCVVRFKTRFWLGHQRRIFVVCLFLRRYWPVELDIFSGKQRVLPRPVLD